LGYIIQLSLYFPPNQCSNNNSLRKIINYRGGVVWGEIRIWCWKY